MGDICRSVVAEPLDLFRNPIHKAEASLDRLCHQIPDHLPGDAPRCGHIAHDFPIATVHAEGHPDPLSVPAGNLEGIRTPAKIAPDHLDSSVMDPHRPSRIPLQKERVLLHDSVNSFMVDGLFPLSPEISIEKRRHSSIPIGGPIIHNLPDQWKILIILCLVVKTFAVLPVIHALLILVRSGNPHRLGNRLHRISSFSNKGTREISFFSRAIRTASLRISTSIVLRPKSLSNSRILNRSSLASETGTTASPALTADSAPSCINLRHVNSWFGCNPYLRATADMLIPGCSVSSTITFFSPGVHRRRRCTDVMISTGPIDTFFLVVVIALYLFLQLISSFKVSGRKGGYSSPHVEIRNLYY
jgi:hypothetical protein